MTRTADDRRAVTGKRRIAFACYADEDRLPGLLVLLRSLALSNPQLCEDFVLLHAGLPDSRLDDVRRLHPRIVTRRAATRREVFLVDDYDTVIVLDTGMVVVGDLGELLRMRGGVGAVPQLLTEDPSKERRTVLGDGLLVIQGASLDASLRTRLADGSSGCLDRELEDVLVRLDARYDFLAYRLFDDAPVPENAVVLRFTAGAGGTGYEPAERCRSRFELSDEEFHTAYCTLRGAKHPELLEHFGLPLLERRPQLDLARQLAEVYRRQGRHQDAIDLLGPLVATDADRPRCHLVLGTSLMAMSRYDEAEIHLLLASAAPEIAGEAYGQLARLAWVRGADDTAHAYAGEGLDADPTHVGCRIMHRRTLPTEEDASGPDTEAGEQLAHVALFSDGKENAGDKVLPEAVRMCLDEDTGPDRWLPVHVHRYFDDAALERVNARRGVVVGGGGLFLPDTAPNDSSAWQWNIEDRTLARITVPLAVFAVGYNIFDGQLYRRQRFAKSLEALVDRSAFFGLRNHGSIERVRELLPAGLRDRVVYQPCPTTVLRQLVPGWTDPAQRDETVLLNCAYDRSGLRFGHDYGYFLAQMAGAVRTLREHADLRYAAHMQPDEKFVHDLRREYGIRLPIEPLYDASNDEVRDIYRRTKLAIGMRGHAGMIPFGCGTPIISLVSHPKLAYFLSDIDRPEWGVSVHDEDLEAKLTERALGVLADHAVAVADVRGRQEELWQVTRENIGELRKAFA
ncbi:MAG: polysaccharide pyruvyl transferase family protein [Streptomyces sp.]|uniref:polysaccharide pyruvyl transferase family protein n=1 Tax=Streptomyces sp. TaxID=1931 RepID=UPI003D6BD185